MTHDRKYRNQNAKISRRDERQHHEKYRCSDRYVNDRNCKCNSTIKFIQSFINSVHVLCDLYVRFWFDLKKNDDWKTLFQLQWNKTYRQKLFEIKKDQIEWNREKNEIRKKFEKKIFFYRNRDKKNDYNVVHEFEFVW